MKDKTRRLITGVILLLAVALFVLGMIILPDTIIMQVQADGSAGNTMPKLVGLLIPLALCAVFGAFYYKGGNGKNLFVALVGLVAFGLMFFSTGNRIYKREKARPRERPGFCVACVWKITCRRNHPAAA